MILTAASIVDLMGVPTTNRGVRDWLKRHEIPLVRDGKRFIFSLTDLPEPVRRAYLERSIEAVGLSAGAYDEVAQTAFLQAPASMRAEAERKAAIARLLVSIQPHTGWPERLHLVRAKFGDKGTSKPTLKRLLRAVKGIDPINHAPALLAGYTRNTKGASVSGKAWSLFLTILRDAGAGFPVKQAYRDVRDLAPIWPRRTAGTGPLT